MKKTEHKIPKSWHKTLSIGGLPIKAFLEVPPGGCLPAFGKLYVACPGKQCALCDLDCDRYWNEFQEAILCDPPEGSGVHFIEFVTQREREKQK